MNIKLYTTSRTARVEQVADEWALGLMQTPGRPTITVEVIRKVPRRVETTHALDGGGRLDWDWLLEQFPKADDEGVIFHFTPYYRSKWGLKPGINGSRNTSHKTTPVFWVCANVGAPASRRDGPGYPEHITELHRLLYHEMAHFDEDQDDLLGNQLPQESVHYMDYTQNAIHRYPELVNYRKLTLLERIRTTLAAIVARLLNEQQRDDDISYLHPIKEKRAYISQVYGVRNALYKKTGRHIGTDYAIPVGTKLFAPRYCRVTATGTHRVLGNWCILQYTIGSQQYEERWLHLQAAPALGHYPQGAVVARSGNTGLSTGPHLHREVWLEQVDIAAINHRNWAQLTRDPEAPFVSL